MLKYLQRDSTFLFYLPAEFQIYDVSFRNEGEKWSTLRYFIDYNGVRYRVKEFFLDWFYTSFPKSLMKSFVESYTNIEVYEGINGKVFLGKDYKGMDASSCFSMGTQIEIESNSGLYLKELNNSLRPIFVDERFRNYPFHERSFFARNAKTSWFEEERIARMKWKHPEHPLSVGESESSSIGIHEYDGIINEVIMIFTEEFFRKVFWIDVALASDNIMHGYYKLRRESNFFTFVNFDGGLLASIQNGGPGIWQVFDSKYVYTVSFSSDVSLQEIFDSFEKIKEIIDFIITKYF